MKPPKTQFEILAFNFEVIINLCKDPYHFCEMWKNYLASCGWTEMEFEQTMDRKVFGNHE